MDKLGGFENKKSGRRILKPPGDSSGFSIAHESFGEMKPTEMEQPVPQSVEHISPMHARRRAFEEQAPGKSFDRLFGAEPATQANFAPQPVVQAVAPPSPPVQQHAFPPPPLGPTGAAVPVSYADALNRVNHSNGGAGALRGPPPPPPPEPAMQTSEQPRSRSRINHNLTSTGFNPVTGEPMAEGPAYVQQKARGPNVQQPPGGHSAGLW
jgi:hypothetical protein